MLLNNAALLDAIETALIEANDAFKGWPELASAALRAIADAGFVIVPREPTESAVKLLERILKHGEIAVIDTGGPFASYGGKKPPNKEMWAVPRHMHTDIEEARSALSAALKEMGAG